MFVKLCLKNIKIDVHFFKKQAIMIYNDIALEY